MAWSTARKEAARDNAARMEITLRRVEAFSVSRVGAWCVLATGSVGLYAFSVGVHSIL